MGTRLVSIDAPTPRPPGVTLAVREAQSILVRLEREMNGWASVWPSEPGWWWVYVVIGDAYELTAVEAIRSESGQIICVSGSRHVLDPCSGPASMFHPMAQPPAPPQESVGR